MFCISFVGYIGIRIRKPEKQKQKPEVNVTKLELTAELSLNPYELSTNFINKVNSHRASRRWTLQGFPDPALIQSKNQIMIK